MKSLDGVRVLLVEDEAIIAMTAEDMLGELGCCVATTAATLAEAMAALEGGGFDIALLDINLRGEQSFPAATALRGRGVPFIFTTGYGSAGRGPEFDDVLVVTKPYQLADLEAAIRRAMMIGA
jgi:CheY-like chemotaxis protein